MSRRTSTRPAIERRADRMHSCASLRVVEIANVEIERITEDLKKKSDNIFRLDNLRNLRGICQEKILFRSRHPISQTPVAPHAYPSQIQYRLRGAG